MDEATGSSPLDSETTTGESGVAKRLKTQRYQKHLACQRCRHRKQKCTGTRPCENCVRSGSECVQPASVARDLDPGYVRSLEERVAELEGYLAGEHARDHAQPPQQGTMPPSAVSQPLMTHSQYAYQAAVPTASSVGSSIQSDMANLTTNTGLSPLAFGNAVDLNVAGLGLSSGRLDFKTNPSLREDHENSGLDPDLDEDTQQQLIDAYFDMAHSQFPVLLKHQFLQWAEEWTSSVEPVPRAMRWKGFFVYMVYSIGYLMSSWKSRSRALIKLQGLHSHAVTKYLPFVMASPDVLIRAQALVLLTIHALHVPSWQNLITLSSSSMRFCIMWQLHLAEMEPQPSSSEALVVIQHRRRIFWCAYLMDKAAAGAHDIPSSIPDISITVPVFNNIDDDDLLSAASFTPAGAQLVDSASITNISSALHVITSRQLRSEIQEQLLRKDFISHSDEAFEWRARMAEKINSWNTRTIASSSPSRKGYASYSWLQMIYYYLFAFLYRPNRISAPGLAGDLSMQACCQALLAWRRIQVTREIAQPWLGLLSQFTFGITLLYCFHATPPSQWKPSYKSPDVPDAIRACSSTLAILAERWTEVECIRDVFEVLAREVPHSETWARPTRISEEGLAVIQENWEKLNEVMIHRPTLRMIHEMAYEDFTLETEMDTTGSITVVAPGLPNSPGPFLFENWDMEWPDDLPPLSIL